MNAKLRAALAQFADLRNEFQKEYDTKTKIKEEIESEYRKAIDDMVAEMNDKVKIVESEQQALVEEAASVGLKILAKVKYVPANGLPVPGYRDGFAKRVFLFLGEQSNPIPLMEVVKACQGNIKENSAIQSLYTQARNCCLKHVHRESGHFRLTAAGKQVYKQWKEAIPEAA